MEVIAGYEFNLNSIVYLLHPNNKFWEVELSGSTVSFRIGKVSGEVEEEDRVQQVEKTYANARQAKDSMRAKIEEKLIKGYYSKDAKKV